LSPNANYVKGRKKEYAVMKKLREEGFQIVARSAGSHSPVDVWAVKRPSHADLVNVPVGEIRLVQVKSGKSAKREQKKALEDIREYAGIYVVTVEVA